jgi:hypothetical protein
LLGGKVSHFLPKLVRLLLTFEPLSVIWAGAMFGGYISCALRRVPRLATPEEADFYCRLLQARIQESIRHAFNRVMRIVQRAVARHA